MNVLASFATPANGLASLSLLTLGLIFMLPSRLVAAVYFAMRRQVALVFITGALVRGSSLTPLAWLKEGLRVSSAVVIGLTAAHAIWCLLKKGRRHAC